MKRIEFLRDLIDLIKKYYGIPEDTYLRRLNIFVDEDNYPVVDVKLERAESKEE
jgi:hypothetical protein